MATAKRPPATATTPHTAPKKRAVKKSAAKPTARSASRATTRSDKELVELQSRLLAAVPEAVCELTHQSPYQLLIATILSAQSTDKMVNAVTPALFERYPTPAALAEADQEEVETLIKRTGFFRNKAKSIRGTAQKLVTEFKGEVPRTLDALITLPGVARKTANVVLGTAYGINSGFVVDTHVARVAQRLGLTEATDPGKIELDLCRQFPESSWSDSGHRVLLHGRYTCVAKAPLCVACPLNELCESRLSAPVGSWKSRAEDEAERVKAGMAANR